MDNKAADSDTLLASLLCRSLCRKTHDSMAAWFKSFNQQTRYLNDSLDRALLGGRMSLNVGFAFASGYQSAIECLFQGGYVASQDLRLSSLCVTETKGNHPRAIQTRLFQEHGRLFLEGRKQFVSGAQDSECLYVACRDQVAGDGFDIDGRPMLKVVALPTAIEGLEIEAMPALGFVPEVSHGKVSLKRVPVDESQVLEGDGYLAYVKAFRACEDVHVLAAVTAYRLGEAINGAWGQQAVLAHIPLILALRAIARMPFNDSTAHLAIASCRTQLMDLIEATDAQFRESSSLAYKAWERDKVLLNIASKAHQTRTQRAWGGVS